MDWELSEAKKQLRVRVKTQQRQANCPVCNTPIEKIHSRYQRTLADLSWGGIQVDLKLQASKFFCLNLNCSRPIFPQRFPSFVAPWSRRTERLAALLTKIGLAQGGLPGSRLTKHLGIIISRQTLLRLVMKTPNPSYEIPKVRSCR